MPVTRVIALALRMAGQLVAMPSRAYAVAGSSQWSGHKVTLSTINLNAWAQPITFHSLYGFSIFCSMMFRGV